MRSSCLFPHSSATGTNGQFVTDNGHAVLRHVHIGQENGVHAKVTGGIEPGERIVLHPNDRIADGVRIEERRAEAT